MLRAASVEEIEAAIKVPNGLHSLPQYKTPHLLTGGKTEPPPLILPRDSFRFESAGFPAGL